MFLIFHDLQFLAILQVLQCTFLFFNIFEYFSPYSWSKNVCVSFSRFLVYLQYSRSYSWHISFFTFFSTLPYSRSNSVHFLFFTFLSFSPYFRSKIVCGSLPRFQVSRDIAGPTVCISHFLCFSVILPIVQVITCLCIIFHGFYFSRHNRGLRRVFLVLHVFHCSLPYSRS